MIGRLLVLGMFVFLLLAGATGQAWADQVEDLQREIDSINRQLQMSVSATTPLEAEVNKLASRMKAAQSSIAQLNAEQKNKEREIQAQEVELSDQYGVFQNRVATQYRYARTYSPLIILLTSTRGTDTQRALKYSLTLAERDKMSIDQIGANILALQHAKAEAARKAQQLASLQAELDKQKAFFEKEIAGAKKFQAELSSKIAALTAQQQKILAEKTGTAQTSVGDVPLADDPNSRPTYDPGFRPAFAVFSFGAPHFKGMSQYGAFGRAKAGQSYETILKAYYGDVEIKKVDMPGSISVSGVGSLPFEGQYLRGIAEMPAKWADDGGYEALKAQAIAARTYALSYVGWRMNDKSVKKSICATEACQVYSNYKYAAGGRWHDAVRDTEGMVVASKSTGDIFATWYASTGGGHTISYTSLGHSTPSMWDTTSDWTRWAEGAWEKTGGSPWFYKAWYKSRSGDSCGRSHPWLTQEEMADILNSWVVRHGGGGDAERVSPLGSCWGGNPFSLSEMRDRARALGEEYSSVSGVRMEHGNNGYTSKVIFETNRGSVSLDGTTFKEVFNLRAPGRIAIKGKLFAIEKK